MTDAKYTVQILCYPPNLMTTRKTASQIHVAPRIVVYCCPLLPIVAHCCTLLPIIVPLLPILTHCCPLLPHCCPIVAHCCPLLSHCCPLLPIVAHCCPLLSTVAHCSQPPARSAIIYFSIDCHILTLTGLNAFVYTGLNDQKWMSWDGNLCKQLF